MNVLSIQSQVVYGHVGNGAAAFALQRLGHEVWAVPTAVLSNHPGHGHHAGRVTPAPALRTMIDGLARIDRLGQCDGILSGWLGTRANGRVVLDAVAAVRRARPKTPWLCDPVIGDGDSGLYVPAALAAFFRDEAIAAADLVTPNQFELAWLTGRKINSLADALGAASALRAGGPDVVVCTSLTAGIAPTEIGTLALGPSGAWLTTTDRIADVPHGAGDLFAAMLLIGTLADDDLEDALRLAVDRTHAVLFASAGRPELELIAAQDRLVRPPAAAKVRRLAGG